ncbi:MAG: DUF4013 domain-containing protein [Anaerolineae bacterium]|nr:DUF4013 domain-containing protein [Anaerolineae bacterium]NUQ05612.1 DUF4013 domain-containing protein [Anaerolineae bacterium]
MDIVRAFTYPFDDRAWVEKLLVTLVITAVAMLLTPLLVGLLGWAALLGYQVELVRNWRMDIPNPLPTWSDFSRLINAGVYPMLALIFYQIPNFIISGTIFVLGQGLDAGVVGSALTLFFSCCMLPILVAYNAISLPMYGLATGRFVDSPRLGVYFEIGYLLVTLRDHLSTAILYLIFLVIASLILGFLGALTIGVVPLAMGIAVFGALNGQLATEILGKPKRDAEPNKAKRR